MPQQIKETSGAAAPAGEGRIKVQLISPGWGSSGYYSQPVLETAGREKVWPAGTHVFFDHPSESEAFDRPERSVRDLAAILDEDAHWDAAAGALVAEARVIGPYRDLVTDPVFVEAVGMSIRASAEARAGEAEGRKGAIVTQLVEGLSVDLVTRAGRGGKVLAVLESARVEARESLSQETRAILQAAVDPGEDDSWVIDFDPDLSQVVYRRSYQDADGYHSEMLRDGYTITDGVATLAGTPEEVRPSTSYLPVPQGDDPVTESAPHNLPAPAGGTTPNPKSQEDNMGTIQVDEAQHASLTEAAGRVPTLESERDTAVQRATAAERELALHKAREAARPIVAAKVAQSTLPATRKARIVESVLKQVTVNDQGMPNADELVTATEAEVRESEAEIAEIAESLGVGTVRGFGGGTTETATVTEADAANAIAAAFGRTVTPVKEA